jgi:nucleoid-associated protein YgaU
MRKMRRIEIITLSLALGATVLLAGCTFQFQTKRGTKTTGKVLKAPKPKVVKPIVKVPAAPKPEVKKVIKVEKKLVTTHTVVKGETLWSIAKEVYGNPAKWKLIYEANKNVLKSPDSLKLGQVLVIPRKEGNGKKNQNSLPGISQ